MNNFLSSTSSPGKGKNFLGGQKRLWKARIYSEYRGAESAMKVAPSNNQNFSVVSTC